MNFLPPFIDDELKDKIVCNLAVSQLSHIYLVQYDQCFPGFSYFAIFHEPEMSCQNTRNSENIGHILLATME